MSTQTSGDDAPVAPAPRGKAAAMLGLATAGPGSLARLTSVLNVKQEINSSGSGTPDIFSYDFAVEFKGQTVKVEVAASSLFSEVYDKVLAGLGDKLSKEAAGRVLYFKETAIYLPHTRRVDSFFFEIGEPVDLSLKKKDKKAFPFTVTFDGRNETVEINSNTNVLGVVQLLPRKSVEDEYMTLWSKKGKIDQILKISSVMKKDEIFDCHVDPDLKSSSSSIMRKKNRKSVGPPKRGMTPSSSGGNIAAGASPKKNLEKFLGNRPSEADLKKKNILVDVKTDQKASAPAAVDANSALPLQLKLFVQLGTFLKDHLDLVGLFRVSGDVEEVKQFYTSMWGKIDWQFAKLDPHVASSALKLYLRKQADPLIPFANYAEFIAAQKLEDDDAQEAALKAALAKLPQPNASIVHYLMSLLYQVAEHEPQNKMNPTNIGIVFGPTIMWDPKPNVMDYSSTTYQSSLVSNLITHYSKYWTTAPPDAGITGTFAQLEEGGNAPSAGTHVNEKASPPPSGKAAHDSSPNASPATAPNPMIDTTALESTLSASLNRVANAKAPAGRPTPPPLGSPPQGPPRKAPPKVPPAGPPSGSSSGGVPPVISASDLVSTRQSFRKSLPPGMTSPLTSSGGFQNSTSLGTIHDEDAPTPPSGPTPDTLPVRPVPNSRRSLNINRLDGIMQGVLSDLHSSASASTAAASATANLDDLRTLLNEQSAPALAKHLLDILTTLGGRK